MYKVTTTNRERFVLRHDRSWRKVLHLNAQETPAPVSPPEPATAPPAGPPIFHEEPPKKSNKAIIAVILVIVILAGAVFGYVYTQTSLLHPSSTANQPGYKTYSNYGFSFQYPSNMQITEKGIQDNTADSSSGIVTAQISSSQNNIILVAWVHSVNRIDPNNVVPSAINGFQQGSGGNGLTVGQQGSATTKAGDTAVYETFSVTVSGHTVNGVWSAWYSTKGQRLYQLAVVTDGQNALALYNTYLSSFTEL